MGMKKIIAAAAITAVIAASAHAAGVSDGNSDLYAWIVDDDHPLSLRAEAGAPAPLAFGSEDLYGSILGDQVSGASGVGTAPGGVGDSYGSILHVVGVHHYAGSWPVAEKPCSQLFEEKTHG